MITYVFVHMMTKQKLIIYVLSIITMMTLACLLMQIHTPYLDQMLFQASYQLYYEQMSIEYLNMFMPFFVVMISMHHESKALQPMYAYVHRDKVTRYKILCYVLFFLWSSILIIIPIYILPYFLTSYYQLNSTFLLKLVMTYLQSFIVLAITFMIISQKHVSFSILIAIAAMVYHMFYQDYFHIYLFYICPFFHEDMLSYTYHIAYQVIYIIMLFLISHLIMVKKEIS